MFKKTMMFDNLEGEEVNQTFYFNYTKKEIAELLEFGYILQFPPKDPSRYMPLEKQLELLTTSMEESGLTQTENNQQAYDIFQDLILNAYGEKGADNVTFVKNERTREYFSSHVAFVELIFEFLDNTSLAAEFLEGCLPAKMVAAAKEEMQKENKGQLTSTNIIEMVQEAERRQQDPATRIEPGMAAAIEAGVAPKAIVDGEAVYVGQEAPTPVASEVSVDEKPMELLTPEDIHNLSEEAFARLNVKRLSHDAIKAAYVRRTQPQG